MPIIDSEMTESEVEVLLSPAPKGEYTLRLIKFQASADGAVEMESEKGNRYIKVAFVIEEGDHKGKFAEYFAMKKSKEYAMLLRAIPEGLTEGKLDTDLAVNQVCTGYVTIDSYEGNEKNVVKRLKPLVK